MANRSKDIGTRAETKVARYLSSKGFPTERKALAGAADKGDLRMTLPDGTEVTLEVKAGAQTSYCPRGLMDKWKEQTLVEAHNSGCKAALVIVRYNRKFRDAEVWIPNALWGGRVGWSMSYLDDFVEEMGG